MEKRESSYTVGGNVNRCSHYEKQYGGSSKSEKQNYHMIKQSHSWAYDPEGWDGEGGGRGFRIGGTCTPMADLCQCMAKTTTML